MTDNLNYQHEKSISRWRGEVKVRRCWMHSSFLTVFWSAPLWLSACLSAPGHMLFLFSCSFSKNLKHKKNTKLTMTTIKNKRYDTMRNDKSIIYHFSLNGSRCTTTCSQQENTKSVTSDLMWLSQKAPDFVFLHHITETFISLVCRSTLAFLACRNSCFS